MKTLIDILQDPPEGEGFEFAKLLANICSQECCQDDLYNLVHILGHHQDETAPYAIVQYGVDEDAEEILYPLLEERGIETYYADQMTTCSGCCLAVETDTSMDIGNSMPGLAIDGEYLCQNCINQDPQVAWNADPYHGNHLPNWWVPDAEPDRYQLIGEGIPGYLIRQCLPEGWCYQWIGSSGYNLWVDLEEGDPLALEKEEAEFEAEFSEFDRELAVLDNLSKQLTGLELSL